MSSNTNRGLCIVCRKTKDNISKHHVKELDNRVVSVCRDCHDVIEWWRRELERMKSEIQSK